MTEDPDYDDDRSPKYETELARRRGWATANHVEPDQLTTFLGNTPGPESWVKRRFLDELDRNWQPLSSQAPERGSLERALFEGNWTHPEPSVHMIYDDIPLYGGTIPAGTRVHHVEHTVELDGDWGTVDLGGWGHVAVVGAVGTLHHHPRAFPGLAAIVARWLQDGRTTTPGWSGTLTDRSPGTPTLRTRMSSTTVLGEGWDRPDARVVKLHNGRWKDVGPAWEPDPDPRPAYRLPIPWDSPLADPIGDLERAAADAGVEIDRW